jgi:hypothetical protein
MTKDFLLRPPNERRCLSWITCVLSLLMQILGEEPHTILGILVDPISVMVVFLRL